MPITFGYLIKQIGAYICIIKIIKCNYMDTQLHTQQSFLAELKSFIENHAYYRALPGELASIPQTDTETYILHDPEGDYETLRVRLILQS